MSPFLDSLSPFFSPRSSLAPIEGFRPRRRRQLRGTLKYVVAMASFRAFLPVVLALLAVATASASAAGATRASLAERLDGEGSQQCWEALMEIKSCTGEIILFFLNGEAYLGPGCCRAIRVIEQRCWAADAVLSFIGFTPEEGDMLKGYCDAGDDADGGSSPPAPAPPHRALDGVAAEGRKGPGAPLHG